MSDDTERFRGSAIHVKKRSEALPYQMATVQSRVYVVFLMIRFDAAALMLYNTSERRNFKATSYMELRFSS